MADATTRRVIEIDAKIGGEALNELRRLQQLTKSGEDSLKSLQSVASTLSSGFGTLTSSQARFASGLQQQLRAVNDARQQLLQYQSAELGLIGSTDDLVSGMVAAQRAIKSKGDAEQQGVAAATAASAAEAARARNAEAFVTSLTLQQEALGKTTGQLSQMQSALLAALGSYDQLREKVVQLSSAQGQAVEIARALASAEGQLSEAQLRNSEAGQQLISFAQQVVATEREQVLTTGRLLDLNAELARSEAEAAAADKRHSDAGQQLLVTLREQIEALRLRNSLGGREPSETSVLINKSLETGVSGQAGPLIGELREQQEIAARLAETNKQLAQSEAEAAAAERKRAEDGNAFIAMLREQNAALRERLTLGQAPTSEENLQAQGNAFGRGAETEVELAQKRELAPLLARQLDLERELIRTEDENAAADARHSETGQQLLATIRAQNAALRERLTLGRPLSADEELQTAGNASGVGAQIADQIAQRNELAPLLARQLDIERELVRSEDEAAAAEKRHSDAGQQLLATLREEIATIRERNLTESQRQQNRADEAGVGQQAAPLIAERDAIAAAALEKEKAAKATEDARLASQNLVRQLQQEIDTYGLDRLAVIEYQAALRGESAAIEPLISQLRSKQLQERADAEAIRQLNAAENELQNTAKNLRAQQEAFTKSLVDMNATAGKSQADILRYRASLLQVDDATKKLVEDTILANKELSRVPAAAHGAGSGLNAGFTSELVVLAHELSQGRFSRFGGSLLVLAEYGNVAQKAFTPLGAAIIGVTAIIGGLSAAIVAGTVQQAAFDRALFLTGNAAGLTNESLKELSHTVASSSGVTIGVAHEITEGLIETGKFGPEAIGHVAVAIGDLARVSTKSAEDIISDFKNITKNVADWAKTSNEQYHFLNLAIFEHIQALELQGKTQEAVIVASDALHNSLDKQKENVGALVQVWRTLREAVSGAVHALEDLGKTKTTSQLITEAQTALQNATARRDESGLAQSAEVARQHGFSGPQIRSTLTEDEKKQVDIDVRNAFETLKGLKEQQQAENEAAALKASIARVQQKGIEATDQIQHTLEVNRGGNRADAAINKLLEQVQSQRAANEQLKLLGQEPLPLSNDPKLLAAKLALPDDSIIDAQIAYFRKRDQAPKSDAQKAQEKLDNAVDKRLADIGRETAATQHQIEVYQLYGEAIDKAARAKVEFDIKSGAFVGKKGAQLDVDDAAKLRAAADKEDAVQRQFRGVKEEAAARKRIDLINQEANANATNEREKQIATETGNLGLSIEADKRRVLIDLIKQAVNARADSALNRQLTQDRAAVDEQINQLETENSLLGLNSIERSKALAALKLEAEARKLLVANPDAGGAIWANATRNIEALTAAMQRNYDEQRRFEVGAKTAFTSFADDATNAAKFSEKVLGDSLNNTTEALANFYATGKFSLSKLISSLLSDFTSQIAKLQIKSLVDEPSIKSGIDKVLGYMQDLLFPAVQKVAGSFTLPTSSIPSANAGTVSDVQSSFRLSEIAQQNAGSIAGSTVGNAAGIASNTAATTAATTALTTFTTTGVTPAQAALSTFTGTGLTPAELALGTFVGTGVSPAQAGLLSFVSTGITPAISALLQFSQSLLAASATAGSSSSGGIGSLFGALFGSNSSGAGNAGQFAGTTGYALGGIANQYGSAFLPSFSGGGLFGPQGIAFLPSFAGGGVMTPAGIAELLSFARGGIMSARGVVPISTFAGGGLMTPFGRLHPERYSDGGGITDRPRLAMFGEGRKPEAYVPLDDGKTMQVVVKQQHGQQMAYVPLPSGKSIPVKFSNEPGRLPLQAYAAGGIHGKPNMVPFRMFATGGTSLDEDPYTPLQVEKFAMGGVASKKRKPLELETYAYGGVGSASSTGGYHSLPIAAFADGGWSSDEEEFSLPTARIALPDGNVVPVTVKHWRGEAIPFVSTPAGTKLPASLLSLDVLHGKTGLAGAAGPGGFGGLFGAVGDDTAQALSGVAGNAAKQTLDAAIGGLGGVLGLATPAGKGGFAGLAGAVGLTDYASSPSDAVKALTGFAGPAADPRKVADTAAASTPQPDYGHYTAKESDLLLRRNKFASFAYGGIFPDEMPAFGMLPLQKFSTGGITDKPTLALFGEGRKKEAYVPLDDGKSIPISIRYEADGHRMFVPLPNGRAIPVSVKTDGYMKLPDGNTLPARSFADGGIMGGYAGGSDSVPLVRSQSINGASSGSSSTSTSGGKGNTYVHIENKGPPITAESETKDLPNGDKQINMIINAAVNAAVNEVDRRIVSGGSTSAALKSRGINPSGALPRRG